VNDYTSSAGVMPSLEKMQQYLVRKYVNFSVAEGDRDWQHLFREHKEVKRVMHYMCNCQKDAI
jgi:hypothetical protein